MSMPKDPNKSDDRSGYREREPRDRDDALHSGGNKPPVPDSGGQPNPDAGGLDRETESDGTNDGD